MKQLFYFATANHTKEDIFKMDLKEINDSLTLIRQAVVNTVMGLWVL
jgi:hypothetical protein